MIETIMSQYANSPRLRRIIEGVWDAIDPDKFTQDYYRLIMSIPTANTHGLDIWGRIVGIDRSVPMTVGGEYFGFSDGFFPFNQRPFSSAGGASDVWDLPDSLYREVILKKAACNIARSTALSINTLLRAIFEGTSYFLITGHMKASYVFEGSLTPLERHLFFVTDLLPRPCGVELSLVSVAIKTHLLAAIEAAESLNEFDYSAATWANLQHALSAGQSVYDDPRATQPEVDAAARAIIDAINNLDPPAGADWDNDTRWDSGIRWVFIDG